MFMDSIDRLAQYVLKTKVLVQVCSTFSGEIKVEENIFGRKLIVGNTTQSIMNRRGREKGVWKSMVPNVEVKFALILGNGGGTVASLLLKKYPRIRISSYEIDPEIVKISKEFFNTNNDIDLHVVDARESFKDGKSYDFIIIDLYKGSSYLGFTDTVEFINQVKNKLKTPGIAVFNRIPLFESKSKVAIFKDDLNKVFKDIKINKSGSNRLYWVTK